MIKTLLVTSATLASIFFSTSASTHEKAAITTTNVFCVLTEQGGNRLGISMRIYEGNELCQTIRPNENGEVEFVLSSEGWHTIEVYSRGYFKKRVQINTTGIHGSKYIFHDLYMAIELVPDYSSGESFNDELDFPFGVFEYDIDRDRFVYSKRYARDMRKLEVEEMIKFTTVQRESPVF